MKTIFLSYFFLIFLLIIINFSYEKEFNPIPKRNGQLNDKYRHTEDENNLFFIFFTFRHGARSPLILRRPLGNFAMQTTPEVLLFADRTIPARTIFSFYYPHLTSIVSVAMISSTVTSNIAARMTMLSIVGIAVPWIHL